jgi:hypothetical protein
MIDKKQSGYASPACSLSEAPEGYAFAQKLSGDETLALLNLLLECERAGAKALRFFAGDRPPAAAEALIAAQLRDEARYAAGLGRHIRRLGGRASSRTGEFFAKAKARPGWPARLELLVRGQSWVESRVRESLPLVADTDLAAFLAEMADTHKQNVAAAAALKDALAHEPPPSG